MKRINARTVELTGAEQIAKEWYESLLSSGWGPREAVERILDAVKIDGPTWNVLNQQDFRDWLQDGDPAVCGTILVVGKVDPSSTFCDQHPNHSGKHEGDDPLGAVDMRVSWAGGGAIKGDALPASNVEWFARPLPE